jgi:WD40 repeat protein
LTDFLYDAYRFLLSYRFIAGLSPLQLYSSALIFAPKASIIRNTFQNCIPSWISQQPEVELGWNAVQQTLEGHSDWVRSVAFSHDSKLLASASCDSTVKIWDTSTGSCHQTVTTNTYITSLSFDSIDSNLLMNSGSIKMDRTGLLTRSEHPQEGRDESDYQGLGISGSWVTWNTQNLLWLPSDYRTVLYSISPSRSIVADGYSSGKVFIIGFSLVNLI